MLTRENVGRNRFVPTDPRQLAALILRSIVGRESVKTAAALYKRVN
jgi:hypothetical protein